MNRKWIKLMAALITVCLVFGGMPGQSAAAAENMTEDIRVVGYEIKAVDDRRQLSELKAGDTALVKVTVRDSRAEASQLAFAGAKINTDAFRLADIDVMPEKKAPEYGDAFVKNIVEPQKMYTLYFYVNYTGAGKNFDFDLFYHTPSASLKMENIKLTFNQCVPSDGDGNLNGGDPGGDGSLNDGDPGGGGSLNGSDPGGGSSLGGGLDSEDEKGVSLTATKLFIQSFDYGKTMPKAGDSIALKINIAASAGSYSIQNVRVTAQFPETVTLLKNTNQYYIGTLGAGAVAEAVYHIRISEDMTGDACEIKLVIDGLDIGGTAVKTEETITLPIRQSERLEIESISMPEKINTVYDDGSGIAQITLINKGSAAAENIEISVDGEGLEISEAGGDDAMSEAGGDDTMSEAHADDEVLEAGKRKNYTINLRAGKEGALSAVVTVRYMGSDGKEKTLEKTVKTEGVAIKAEVSKNVTIDKEIIVEEEKVPVWAWLAAAVGILAGIYVIVRILYDKWRIYKKRQEI